MELVQARTRKDWKKIRELYLEAFPSYERRPLWMIWLTQKRGKSDVWCLVEKDEFVGMATTVMSKDLVLLDYFAIDRKRRGGGLGSKSLQKLQRYYEGKRFFLEIESIYEDVNNLEERKRRKQFYLTNGMTEMKVMANLFGTKMELLGYQCEVDFVSYYFLYIDAFGDKIAKNVKEEVYPETREET